MIKTHRDSFPWLSPAITLAEISEAFCEGHVAAFAFFGGVPRSILSVKEICGDTKLAMDQTGNGPTPRFAVGAKQA